MKLSDEATKWMARFAALLYGRMGGISRKSGLGRPATRPHPTRHRIRSYVSASRIHAVDSGEIRDAAVAARYISLIAPKGS